MLARNRRTGRVQAHVDGIREFRMFGWACGKTPGEESIVVLRGDEPLAAPVWRVPRADVGEALGVDGTRLGFEIDLPPTLWAGPAAAAVALHVEIDGVRLWDEFALGPADIEALVDVAAATADGPRRRTLIGRALLHLQALGSAAGLDAARRAVLAEVAGPHADPLAHLPPLPPPFSVQLESWHALLVDGWILGARPGHERIELLCEGAPLPCWIRRTPRADVARAMGSTHPAAGFELEIPGAAWRRAPDAARLRLALRVDGFPTGPTIVLERARLGVHLRDALAQPVDDVRRQHVLLALEHVAEAGGLAGLADDGERALARGAAREHGFVGLDEGAPAGPVPDARAAPGAPPASSAAHRRRLIDRRLVARAALALLLALRRRAPRHPGAARHADALERRLLRATGLFDEALYRGQLPADAAPASPLHHYLVHGAPRGLLGCLLFDPRRYVAQLPGGRAPPVDALLHYALAGRFEGRAASAWFDTRHYLARHPDVRRGGANPLRHFLSRGWREGRAPFQGADAGNADRQRVELRAARRELPDEATPLSALLAGLPSTTRPWPRGRALPWWPETTLDGIDHDAPALWSDLRPRARAPGPAVDVLVPVYAGLQETLSCLRSLLVAPVEAAFELVVIDDASPEPALSARLRELAARGLFTLHANDANLGFVRTVNRGLALHPERDVVILNADTVVHAGWLDRLLAHRRPGVASVTPLSNNATLCSYPVAYADNSAPLEIPHAQLDRLCAEVNAGVAARAPTGVGFCMLMARDALDAIGAFDERRFGRGYGEENDWCQRCERAGFEHLLAADVHVRHRGAVSFGGEADARMHAVLATLEGLHPGYLARIEAHAQADPLAGARVRLDVARLVRADPRRRVISVSHARGGGTERAEAARSRRREAAGLDVVALRPGARPGTLAVVSSSALRLPNLRAVPLTDAPALAALLASLNVVEAQIHHLVDFPPGFRAVLMQALARLDIAPEIVLHDYHAICPRINLVDASGAWCGEHGPAQCAACLATGGLQEPVVSIEDWRAQGLAELQAARAVEVPDADVADRLRRHFPALAPVVVPHEGPVAARPAPAARTRFDAGAPARVLAIGALSAVKGYEVVRGLAGWASGAAQPLRVELLGFSQDDAALEAAGVAVHGRYEERELAARLDALAPDLILVPSVWPETYCYVLSAAFASGRRTAVFDLGAQGRRLRERGGGLVLPLALAGRPDELGPAVLAFLRDGIT